MENKDNKNIKDLLAVKRTHLANERTLLAYSRTALTLIGLGVLLIKYEPSEVSQIIGIFSIALAFIISGIGIFRFFKTKRQIDKG